MKKHNAAETQQHFKQLRKSALPLRETKRETLRFHDCCYGVSLSCKRGLKRTQTKTGVSEGVGGEDSRKRKRSQTRVQKCTLFFEKNEKFLLPAFSKVWSSTLTAQCERRVCSKASGSQNYESVSWSSFHAAQAENRKRTELVFRVEAKFSET